MLANDHAALFLLAALVLDAAVGDPDWLWRRAPHPVVVMGRLISVLDRSLNHDITSDVLRRLAGGVALAIMIAAAIAAGLLISAATEISPWLAIIEIIMVAILIAQRSLYQHVARVRQAFSAGGLDRARDAVAMIVGRDPATLDEPGICRASIESAAENFSDGVVAPAFWYLVGGLPGILAYKMINTADSMIGHRTPRHQAFGWAAARIDDVVNLIPARLSALLLILAAPLCGGSPARAAHVTWRDARQHKSPNAGWPEAAMAGILGIALAGPRTYAGKTVNDPWMNADGRREAAPDDIERALGLLVVACAVHALMVAGIAVIAAT